MISAQSFAAKAPKTFQELLRWRAEGIIDFRESDMLDETVAALLAAVRKYIRGESHA